MSTRAINVRSMVFSLLVSATAVLAFGLAMTPTAKAEGQQVSKPVWEKYEPAQAAFKNKDYAAALKLAKEGLAVSKSSFEKLACLTVAYQSAVNSRSYSEAIEAGEQLIAVEGVPSQTKLSTLKVLPQLYFATNRLDKAVTAQKEYMRIAGSNSSEDWNMLAQMYSQQKNCADALPALEKALAGGKSASEPQLQLQSACFAKGTDFDKRLAVNEELLRRFPKKDYFKQVLFVYQATKKLDDYAYAQLLRFGYEHDYLDADADYIKLAEMALDVGTTGEALRILEKGIAKKTLKAADKVARLLDQAKSRSADDAKRVDQLDKEARAGKNGETDLKVGYIYFGMGQYDKAAEAIARALQPDHVAKVKRVDDANMMLGVAYTHGHKKAEADKAFAAAKAAPQMAAIAKIWTSGN